MYNKIFEPISIGNVTLKNKIVFSPTSMGLSLDEMDQRIIEIASGGCAMIVIGDVPVSKKGHLSLHSKKGFAYYQHICELIHTYDCQVCAQLHHSDSNFKAMFKYLPKVLMKKISPSEIRDLLNQEVGPYITHLSTKKVKEITSSFGEAAFLANKAGFDMIQVHGDRMCGSFSSSIFNKREDVYGGKAENRARFAIESIQAIRSKLPSIPIEYKLAIRQEQPHYGNAGVLLEEVSVFVPLLEKAGVDSFQVTLANHGSLSDTIPPANHEYFSKEGCFLPYCDEVKKYTTLPICGVGKLSDPTFIEQQLMEGRIQYFAMSRQLIADASWPNKVHEGKMKDIHMCIRCNVKCLGGMQKHQGVHCIYETKEEL